MRSRALGGLAAVALLMMPTPASAGRDIALFTFTEQLRAYDPATNATSEILPHEQYVNGYPCFFPGATGRFVQAEDYDRDHDNADCGHFDGDSTCDPPGWRIFELTETGGSYHRVLTSDGGLITIGADQDDPLGCAFDADGNLLAVDVGSSSPITKNGRFLKFFEDAAGGPYTQWCEIDRLASPNYVILDEDGNALVSEAGGQQVHRYSDLPASPSECADYVANLLLHRAPFIVSPFSLTPFGIVPKIDSEGRHDGHYYLASVLAPMSIDEYDELGLFVRNIALPFTQNMPTGISVDHEGTVYFVELALAPVPQRGRFRRIRFDPVTGLPGQPETLYEPLSVADGTKVVDSDILYTPYTPPQ